MTTVSLSTATNAARRPVPLPQRSTRNIRVYLLVGMGFGICGSFLFRWAIAIGSTMRSGGAFGAPLHPINYFDKGDVGYLSEKYCIDNSHRKECCSKYHCNKIVNRSTLYSECCHNVHIVDDTLNPKQRSKILPLLITSAPRSGTRFIQQLFTMVGLHGLTTDERTPLHRGIVSWKHIFNDDVYSVGRKNPTHLYKSKFRVIWHLVRDPLEALTSLSFTEPLLEDTDESKGYMRYISKHIPVTNQTYARQKLSISDEEWDQRSNHNPTISNETVMEAVPESEKIHKFLIYRGMEIYLHWHGFINYLNVPIFRLEDLSEKKNVTVLDEVFYSVGMKPPRHEDVLAYLNVQEQKKKDRQHRRRLVGVGADGEKETGKRKRYRDFKIHSMQLHKNERDHRDTLGWIELCHVDPQKAREMLKMSQSFGYYKDLKENTLCQVHRP